MSDKTRDILKKIRRIEIKTKKIVNSTLSGAYHSSFRGRGMEFDEVKEYVVGDDIRSIDWNVTARMNQPFTKRFREERELVTMILFDASSSNEFGSTEILKGEVAAEISAILAFSAIKNNDKVGLVIFSDCVEKYIPPNKGREHVLRVIREILFFKTKNKKTDIAAVIDFLNRVQIKKCVVFLISDMISNDFFDPLKIASERHDFTAIKITDPREVSFPDVGIIELEDAETGETIIMDTSDKNFLDRYYNESVNIDEQLKKQFAKLKIDFLNLGIDRNYFDDVVLFFKKKALKNG